MKALLARFLGKKSTAIPDALWAATLDSMPFLDVLTVDEKIALKSLSEAFLAQKEFSTGPGLELSADICVAIAAQGCLPILKLGLGAYRDWVGIVVYPDEFVVPRQFEDEAGVVHEFNDVLSGEAWAGGPLILSWHDVKMAGDGYNVVIHEFAHKLDMLNGDADGIPALHSGIDQDEWEQTLLAAYDDFCIRVDHDDETRLDPYASDSPAEFFAVLSESFFEMPDVIAAEYPAFFALLKRYYRQDPLTRQMKASSADNTAAS